MQGNGRQPSKTTFGLLVDWKFMMADAYDGMGAGPNDRMQGNGRRGMPPARNGIPPRAMPPQPGMGAAMGNGQLPPAMPARPVQAGPMQRQGAAERYMQGRPPMGAPSAVTGDAGTAGPAPMPSNAAAGNARPPQPPVQHIQPARQSRNDIRTHPYPYEGNGDTGMPVRHAGDGNDGRKPSTAAPQMPFARFGDPTTAAQQRPTAPAAMRERQPRMAPPAAQPAARPYGNGTGNVQRHHEGIAPMPGHGAERTPQVPGTMPAAGRSERKTEVAGPRMDNRQPSQPNITRPVAGSVERHEGTTAARGAMSQPHHPPLRPAFPSPDAKDGAAETASPNAREAHGRPSLKPFPTAPKAMPGTHGGDDARDAYGESEGAYGEGEGTARNGHEDGGHGTHDGMDAPKGHAPAASSASSVPAASTASDRDGDGERRRFSSKADDESRYKHDAEGNRLNGPGTGRRAGDKTRRNSRAGIGVVLSDSQAEEINRMNTRARKRDIRATAFQMTKRDQQVFDYLVRWRFATIRDVSRIAGWSESYMRTNRRFNSYIDLGLVHAERVPLENYRYVQATPRGAKLSQYAFLGTDNDLDVLRSYRGHAFGLSSLASHLMNARKDADDEERDLLGVGEDEWTKIRHEIRDGVSHVVAEREYRSAWSRIRATAAGRSPSALTEGKYRHAMEEIFRRAHEDPNDLHSPMARETMEFFSTNPEYQGENAWLWVVYGNDMIQRDGNGGLRRLSVDSGQVALDDKGRPVPDTRRGDLFSTQDHCPDMVIARPRDKETGRPNSIAVELELTTKDADDYVRIMCGYMSANGRLLYKTVVWQVVNAALGNVIRKAAVKTGAVEGKDFIIAPVYSVDMKSCYNRGADMLPGQWSDPDDPRGYTIAKSTAEQAGYADLSDILEGR